MVGECRRSVTISTRIPPNLLEDVEKAKKIVGATSISDLLRDALREYLKQLSLLSDRAERVKSESKEER